MAQGKLSDGVDVTSMVAVGDITIGDRLRPVDGQAVAALMASVEQIGLIQPIQLRQIDGALLLIAGAHRLEAHKRLGRGAIRAEIRACTDAEAELIEIEENLVEAELTTLDLAVHLARQKALYEALNPETVNGRIGAAARWGDATETVSFASAVAERRGITERHIRGLTRIGANLGPASVIALRQAKKAPTYRILADLAAEGDRGAQAQAATALADGRAKRVADALTLARGQIPPVAKAADERAFDALRGAFDRAPTKVRAQFFELLWAHHGDALERALEAQQAHAAAAAAQP